MPAESSDESLGIITRARMLASEAMIPMPATMTTAATTRPSQVTGK